MKKEHLVENEELITQSDDQLICLTTKRIRYTSKSWGKSYLVSIHLEKISSIEVRYKSWVIILLIGILLGAASLFVSMQFYSGEDIMVAGLGLSFLCILTYFMTRKHVVTISSDGGASINFYTRGMKDEKLLEFINKVEQAKCRLVK
ncbi:MAG: hypothetical protein HYZ14_05095 [Bacteroidetes bacterium]|nr:hypothetical protein [Bacteroidota bacterium]